MNGGHRTLGSLIEFVRCLSLGLWMRARWAATAYSGHAEPTHQDRRFEQPSSCYILSALFLSNANSNVEVP